jgi:hypothetical protein
VAYLIRKGIRSFHKYGPLLQKSTP